MEVPISKTEMGISLENYPVVHSFASFDGSYAFYFNVLGK
ncbi:hypothetical protein DSOL_1607 [Desulfosporosinus metallidurans]|uniref:Uncharacterized protein n=1 Tax=Desulfosporosinus metallidurans TaxID=1888891 RepID=A0A1Q8QYX1_9FIRM|nr:hypothetical protein DSOL_1600 [Desulfosporosinus metallidurans]OLN32569.1 hypothetical protein DSOL_1607 [Desulfosporosinus metallidurans]